MTIDINTGMTINVLRAEQSFFLGEKLKTIRALGDLANEDAFQAFPDRLGGQDMATMHWFMYYVEDATSAK